LLLASVLLLRRHPKGNLWIFRFQDDGNLFSASKDRIVCAKALLTPIMRDVRMKGYM